MLPALASTTCALVQWLLRYRCAAGSATHFGSDPGAATTRTPDYYLMQTRREMFPFHRSSEDLVNVNSFTSVSARTGGSVFRPTTAGTCGGFMSLGCRWSRLPATGPRGGLVAAFNHGTGWWAGHSALSDHSRCFKAVNKRGSPKPAAQGSIEGIFEFSGVCWITPCLRRLAPKATAMSPRFRGLASLGPRHAWPGARCGRSSRRNPVHHAKTRSASGTLRNVTRSRGPR